MATFKHAELSDAPFQTLDKKKIEKYTKVERPYIRKAYNFQNYSIQKR